MSRHHRHRRDHHRNRCHRIGCDIHLPKFDRCCDLRYRGVCNTRGYRFMELEYFDSFNLREAGVYGYRGF